MDGGEVTNTITMSTVSKTLAAILLAAAVGVAVYQAWQTSNLRDQVQTLQQQQAPLAEELQQIIHERDEATNRLALLAQDGRAAELLKLRGEVGMLRGQVKDVAKLREENSKLRTLAAAPPPTSPPAVDDAQEQAVMHARLGDAKQSCLGLFLFAADNGGRFPTNLDQLTPYVKGALTGTNAFDLLYQGPMTGLTNAGSTIVLRERTPVFNVGGGWTKIYGFADGHAESHLETSGDFTTWETPRLPPPASGP